MKPLNDLYDILAIQQSIRVGRLRAIIINIHREISLKNVKIQLHQATIKSQQETIERLNKGQNRYRNEIKKIKRKLESEELIMDSLSFGQALEEVKNGKGMRLPQWAPDVVVKAQYPDEHSKMTAPYLYVESRFGKVPWKETMIELFAENWEVV